MTIKEMIVFLKHEGLYDGRPELTEAAEIMEKLEEALRYIIDEWANEYETGGLENFCRAALGEKKDD